MSHKVCDIEIVTHHHVASSDLDRTRNYLKRGRALEGDNSDALAGKLVKGMDVWARDVSDRDARRPLDDVMAEYGLRGEQVPFTLVADVMDVITNKILDGLRNVDRPDVRRLTLREATDQAVERARRN